MTGLDWRRARQYRATESVQGDICPARDQLERQADREMRRWAGRTGLDLDALDAAPPKGKRRRRKPAKTKISPAAEPASPFPEEAKPLRDKFGNQWPERVLTNWSALAIEALGVHRVAADER